MTFYFLMIMYKESLNHELIRDQIKYIYIDIIDLLLIERFKVLFINTENNTKWKNIYYI